MFRLMRNLLTADRFPGGRDAVGLLALRLVCGTGMFLWGLPKIADPFAWQDPLMGEHAAPAALQACAAYCQCVGGACVAVGLLSRLHATLVVAIMAWAIAFKNLWLAGNPLVRLPYGDIDEPAFGIPTWLLQIGGPAEEDWELAALYGVTAFVVVLLGPGAVSLDRALFGRRE